MSFGSYSIGSVAYGGRVPDTAVVVVVVFTPKPRAPAAETQDEATSAPVIATRYAFDAPVAAPATLPRRTGISRDDDVPELQEARRQKLLYAPVLFFKRPRPILEEETETPIPAKPRTLSRLLPVPKRRQPTTTALEDTAQDVALPKRGGVAAWLARAYNRVMQGRARVANDAVAGYVVYVGYGAMPDFNAPAGFGATLPVATAITPPVSGTITLWVVTRARDVYGLESQNTHPQYITINSSGDEDFGPLTAPVITGIIEIENDSFQLQVNYPGFATDANPGDTWLLYVGAGVPPVPGVDAPAGSGTVTDGTAIANLGPYPTGGMVYYFAVTVYRALDGLESAAGTGSVTLPADPAEPEATPGETIADNEV